jgi:hypothetical protein
VDLVVEHLRKLTGETAGTVDQEYLGKGTMGETILTQTGTQAVLAVEVKQQKVLVGTRLPVLVVVTGMVVTEGLVVLGKGLLMQVVVQVVLREHTEVRVHSAQGDQEAAVMVGKVNQLLVDRQRDLAALLILVVAVEEAVITAMVRQVDLAL